jgi:hypothetical protein
VSTVYRFPINVVGYIELGDRMSRVRVVVDKLDWEYAPWPRICGNDEDPLVVQIEESEDQRFLNWDVEIVDRLRSLAELRMDGTTPWQLVDGAEHLIDGTMVP